MSLFVCCLLYFITIFSLCTNAMDNPPHISSAYCPPPSIKCAHKFSRAQKRPDPEEIKRVSQNTNRSVKRKLDFGLIDDTQLSRTDIAWLKTGFIFTTPEKK